MSWSALRADAGAAFPCPIIRLSLPSPPATTLDADDDNRQHRGLEPDAAATPSVHLAAVFGLDPKTAIRYAENARLLLQTAAEQQAARVPSAENSLASSPHSS